MVLCPSCNRENSDDFAFCGHCGARLAPPRQEHRKTVTVLFCDLTGSTALGEQLDPEALRATMRGYHSELRAALERHGATVEKFAGDAVMAVFGIPRSHEDDALRAVRAAVEMWAAVDGMGLQARIGVNTGEVVVGEGETLAVGDAVNVAARLEQQAEPGEILIGAVTRELVRDAVRTEPLRVVARGKAEPVDAHRLVAVDVTAPAVSRRLDAPLIGRTRELARLQSDFESTAAESRCHLFTLLGSAGVGKSRLVREFLRTVDAGAVSGRCLHYGDGITYWPLVEVLIQLGSDPEAVLGLPSPAEASVAARRVLEAAASDRPLVVVFDDLQWAEATFLDLVEHVADWARDAPIFLLCIARPELLELRPSWGGGKLNATSVLLEPLGADEASRLMDSLPGGADLEDELRARIFASSGGNPLFVEEMLLMLDEWDGHAAVTVPPTIHALLQARLDQLDSEERTVIERGAVEGEVFHRAPVAELAPEGVRNTLDIRLAGLMRKELIRPAAATMPDDDAFRFRHLLIRDAAYEALPKATRAELHEGFATWFDAHARLVEQDEIVGYHLEQAVRYRRELGTPADGLAPRAAERLAAAGRAALARGDNRAGTALLDRAAMLLPVGAEARLALLPELVIARRDLGGYEESAPLIDELAAADSERWQAYATLFRFAHDFQVGTGSLARRELVLAAADALERTGDEAGVARALEAIASIDWGLCHIAVAIERFREALRHAQRSSNIALVEELRERLIRAEVLGPTPVAEAEAAIRGYAEGSTGVVATAALRRSLGILAAMGGDFETGRRLTAEAAQELADAGYATLHAVSSQTTGEVEWLAGEWQATVDCVLEGFAALTDLGEHAFASTNAALAAGALLKLGRDDEARHWLKRARELAPGDDLVTLITVDVVEAVRLARADDAEQAERLARSALDRAEQTDDWLLRGWAHEALAEVLRHAQRGDEARAVLEAGAAIYEAKGVVPEVERVRALVAEL